MEAAEDEEERRAGLEGRTTDTRTEAGDLAVTAREEAEAEGGTEEEEVADLATVEVETPTGADLQGPRVAVEETMAAHLMTGGEKRLEGDTHLSFSCIYILPGEVVSDWHLPSLASSLGRSRFSYV